MLEVNIGDKFGRWEIVDVNTNRKRYVVCRCECSDVKREVNIYNMVSGKSRSCGCLAREAIRISKRVHGDSTGNETKEYRAWSSIKRRCYNPNVKDYPNYGGRGIAMCAEWINDYTQFLADVGRAPTSNHQIDRIDVNANYTPGNTRWVTLRENVNNRRCTFRVEYKGVCWALAELCELLELPYKQIWERIRRKGFTVEEAIETPFRKTKRWHNA